MGSTHCQAAATSSARRLKATGKAGVFDSYEHVYRKDDAEAYTADRATKPGRSFNDWRTYRMSDHLPMWIEFGLDNEFPA